MWLVAVISIPSASAAVPADPKSSQPSAASVSADDPNSFASQLKSSENRQSEEQQDQGPAYPKASMGVKDKPEKDTKKNTDEKKMAPLAGSMPVPVPVTPGAEARSFMLSWPVRKEELKADNKQSVDKAPAQGAADNSPLASAAAMQSAQLNSLKTSGEETLAKAPVAFGATLTKLNGTQPHGQPLKTASPSTAGEASAKPIGEASKSPDSRSSSGKQHSSAAHDDHSSSPDNKEVTATTAAVKTQGESFGAIHAAAPVNQTAAVAATAQNAYPSTQASSAAAGIVPTAPVAKVVEPVETPVNRFQNIDLKIAGADNSQVDVRVSQRAGDVQVTVRTPDGDLAQSLRQHLPELSDRLSQTGTSGELWQPQTAQAGSTGGNNADSRYSDDAQTQQDAQQQQSRDNAHAERQQQENETAPSKWLNELNQAEKETN